MKWRIAYINAYIEGADFVTIQYEDFTVIPYCRDWRERYASQMALDPKGDCKVSIGNAYGPWRTVDGDPVPE